MPFSVMLRRVTLVRSNFSQEHIATITKITTNKVIKNTNANLQSVVQSKVVGW
jgi:hypothetical protein